MDESTRRSPPRRARRSRLCDGDDDRRTAAAAATTTAAAATVGAVEGDHRGADGRGGDRRRRRRAGPDLRWSSGPAVSGVPPVHLLVLLLFRCSLGGSSCGFSPPVVVAAPDVGHRYRYRYRTLGILTLGGGSDAAAAAPGGREWSDGDDEFDVGGHIQGGAGIREILSGLLALPIHSDGHFGPYRPSDADYRLGRGGDVIAAFSTDDDDDDYDDDAEDEDEDEEALADRTAAGAFPTRATSLLLVGTFPPVDGDDDDDDVWGAQAHATNPAACETVGCLCDSVVVRVPVLATAVTSSTATATSAHAATGGPSLWRWDEAGVMGCVDRLLDGVARRRRRGANVDEAAGGRMRTGARLGVLVLLAVSTDGGGDVTSSLSSSDLSPARMRTATEEVVRRRICRQFDDHRAVVGPCRVEVEVVTISNGGGPMPRPDDEDRVSGFLTRAICGGGEDAAGSGRSGEGDVPLEGFDGLVDGVYSALLRGETMAPTAAGSGSVATATHPPAGRRRRGGVGGVASRRYALAANGDRGRPSFVAAGGGGGGGSSGGGNDVSEEEEESESMASPDGGSSPDVRAMFDSPGDDDDGSGDYSNDDEEENEVERVNKEGAFDPMFDGPGDDDDGSGDYSDDDEEENEVEGVDKEGAFDPMFDGPGDDDDGSGDYSDDDEEEENEMEGAEKEGDPAQRIERTAREATREAEVGLSALEAKQDGAALAGRMPILEFGSDADAILQGVGGRFGELLVEEEARAGRQQQASSSSSAMDLIQARRSEVLRFVAGDAGGMRRLYHRQLDALREHYGRRYEAAIEDIIAEEEEEGGEEGPERNKERRGDLIAGEASRATEGFRSAAQNAIPRLCREGQELRDVDGGYEYTTAMAGLIEDMMEATALVEGAEADWAAAASLEVSDSEGDEDDGDDNGIGRKGKRPMKWYHKLGARLVVLGINYLQGALALQGLKKAAADRDKNMPKFPLF